MSPDIFGYGWTAGSRISVRGLVPVGLRTDEVSDLWVNVGDALRALFFSCAFSIY